MGAHHSSRSTKREKKMSFLRRSTQSIITNIRQITVKNVAQTQRENAAKAITVGAGQQMLNQSEFHRAVIAHISTHKHTNVGLHFFGDKNAQFSMPIGAKCVFSSQSARVSKMFASFA